MSLFNRIFGGLSEHQDDPVIKFGRFTDSHKTSDQMQSWEEALTFFDQDRYQESLIKTLGYLKEEGENNTSYTVSGDVLNFEIRQGSKRIEGHLASNQLYAEAKVAKTNGFSIGYLRRLIEKNYSLNYCRFALDDDNSLTLVMDFVSRDSPPHKLYNAFKEMAINADKQDDLLLEEFYSLSPIHKGHLTPLDSAEKEAKFAFLISKIKMVLEQIEQLKLSPDKKPGAQSYLLLDLIYRLDYLISPEGKTMESFEKMHREYYAKNAKSLGHKNAKLITQLKELIKRPKDNYLDEFYNISSTFGITTPISHDRIIKLIDPEVKYINWYITNRQPETAVAVCGYLAGFCLFNYAPPKPIHQLLHLYYAVSENAYFKSLGIKKSYFDQDSDQINREEIEKEIKDIETSNKEHYPDLKIPSNALNYNSIVLFSRSFFLMLRQLSVVKKDQKIQI